ncbi:hypothetical protein BDZ85DRAFT_296511 [Elsinoe ampelina]|uniref:Uncharacterized protein n=1 Tax=Elsinoe ampelina TaxID=302913 RepID=A0A6A6G997_9PEZI|nr:hypothetical protein BDZ85DRAFT_296511 [Elsinoe ampelina]
MDLQRSQEELVDLFARSLSLAAHNPATPQQQFTFPSDRSKSTVYASTHYNQPMYSTVPVPGTEASIEFTLRQNDIDPAFLFPCQLDLFHTAGVDQRLRLLELWRTAPLRAGDKEAIQYQYGELVSTNLLQEEVLARLRVERRLAEQRCVASQKMDEAEPYMVSGYTVDTPVKEKEVIYMETQGLWESPPPSYEQSMEDQYGAIMAARDFERFQDLHRQVQGQGDDEMMI